MTTSERVVAILTGEGGYRELPKPLKVGSLSFEFTHALIAGDRANDLVIVIELKGDSADDVVIRKVLALTRALDVLQSKRSVTTVLTSGHAASDKEKIGSFLVNSMDPDISKRFLTLAEKSGDIIAPTRPKRA